MSIIDGLRHHLSVASCMARLAIQRQIEYPLFLCSWLLMIPIQYLSGIWMLKILVDRFHPLAGWTFPQLAFVYGLGLLSHGVMIILSIQSWQIEYMVVYGRFDRMLLQPLNVFFQFTFQYINFIGMIDLIPATLVFSLGCKLVGFQWTAMNAAKLVIVVLGAALLRSGFYTVICSTAFWTKKSAPLQMVGHELLERSTLYPLAIYPYLMQFALTFLIPLGFISFYPACEFLGQNDRSALPLGLAVWTPVAGGLMFLLAQFVFNRGLRAYESSGN